MTQWTAAAYRAAERVGFHVFQATHPLRGCARCGYPEEHPVHQQTQEGED